MILKNHCNYCKKQVDVKRVEEDSYKRIIHLACLHTQTTYFFQSENVNIISSKGDKLFPFQKKGVAFALNSGMRCLINDEMGLGKTPQSLGAVHIGNYYPCLIVVKSGLRMQWFKQCINWTGNIAQIIEKENEPSFGLKFSIISIDLIHRFKDIDAFCSKFNFKCVIIDEVQSIKNHDSKRTNSFRKVAANIPHFISLSGTPIKNNALEYFPVLNLARPDKFPTLVGFQNNWCDTYYSGYSIKIGGIKNSASFKEYTKDFILRRSRSEVLPQLPKILRTAQFEELGKDVENAYKQVMREFQDEYENRNGTAFEKASNILSYLTKMRHLTGISKIPGVCNYIQDFLTETDKKIVVFLHHKDVNTLLKNKLDEIIDSWKSEFGEPCLTLESSHSSFERNDIIDKFQKGKSRILIASTLAAGEGVDGIQNICSDIIIMERQWNPANEEQVEGRIERMGQEAQKITATYFIATGTVDEFFAEIVEKKRGYMNNTLDGKEYIWDQSSIIKDLAAVLAEKGGKKWGF